MKKLLLISLLLPFTASAEITNDIIRCSNIKAKEDRLDCFDSVADYYKRKGPVTARKSPPASSTNQTSSNKDFGKEPSSDGELASLSNVASYYKEQTSETDSTTPSREDYFGKTAAELTQLESIQATVVGTFNGWKKDAIIELSNGQKWKVIGRSAGYVDLQNPEVKITRGFLDSYYMEIEGLNAKGKVKRIK